MLHLRLDASSQYFVGDDQVSLQTLRKYAARERNQFDVFYENKSLRVTRMILRAQLDAADKSAKQPVRTRSGGATEPRNKS